MRKKFLRRLALGMAVVVGITSVSVSNLGSAKAETNVTATSQSEEATLPVTIGATDCSTAWWGAHSENWNVEKGQTLVVSFTNYNRYDPAIGNFVEGTNPTGYQSYQNYAVVFSSAPFGDAAYAEWMVSSAAHNSWGSKVPTGNPNQRSWVNWETHGVDYNGASMKLVVSRDENNVVTYTAYALSTDGDRWYNGNTFTLTDSDDCFVHLTVDNSYLTITDIQYYEGVVVGAPDMSSGHDFCPTPSIEVNDGDTVTYNLVNYVGAYNHEAVRTFLSNVAFGGADRSDYLIMRLDNYIDGGTCKGADGWNTNVGTLATNYNWDVFRSACSGAPTTLTVSRSGARVTYRIDIDGLDGVKYYNEAQIDLPSETDPCYVWLSTTFSYFVMDTGIAHADAGPDLKVDVDKTVQVEPGIVASFSDITYTSSDPSVATVDANGVVTGVDKGTATITVTYTNGESVASDTCTVTVYKPMTGITVDKSEVDLYVGPGEDTHTIKVTVAPSNTTDTPVITYESSDETVATVSEDGEVTAVGPGTATITVTATAGDNVQTAEVKVNAWQEPTLIKVDNSEIVVNTGKTEQIKYTVLPENANVDYTVKFDTTDTDTSVATIDANGVVTGVIPGTTSVYVELYVGENETASYALNVTITVKQPMTGLETNTPIYVNKGNTADIEIELLPSDTTDEPTYTYKSADTSIATVDANGKVTGVGAGETTITVTATAGDNVQTAEVAVNVFIQPEGVTVEDTTLDVYTGKTVQIDASMNPEDAYLGEGTELWIMYTSTDKSIATVDEDGVITGVKAGTATIKVSLLKGEGNFVGEDVLVTINVKQPMTGIESSVENDVMYKGDEQTIDTLVLPSTTEDEPVITYVSSDDTVATVDKDGKITAVGKGEATITVTATVGDNVKTDTVEITVLVYAENVTIDSTMSIVAGESEDLAVKVGPEGCEKDYAVEFKSSKESVATVDANGKVTAVAEGTAVITAVLKVNGEEVDSAECAVTVQAERIPMTGITATADESVIYIGGDVAIITATVVPEDTTDEYTVTYESSNINVATVDSTGKVTAVGAGDVIITVKAGEFTATVVFEVRKPVVDSDIEAGEGAPEVDVEIKEEDLEEILDLTEEEKEAVLDGAEAILKVEVNDASSTVTADEKAKIETALKTIEKVVLGDKLIYMDIDVNKLVGQNSTALTELKKAIDITVAVPTDWILEDNSGRTYKVVRIHNGVAELLDGTFDAATKTFTFSTDKFSTYALTYVDAAKSGGTTDPEKTGDFTNVAVVFAVLLGAAGAFIVARKRKVTE